MDEAIYRQRCASNAMDRLTPSQIAHVQVYANSEFWAGWNAAIHHAARVAEGRHRCWQESTLGSSAPECDVTACEDIAIAIRMEVHPMPPKSRPVPNGDAPETHGKAEP